MWWGHFSVCRVSVHLATEPGVLQVANRDSCAGKVGPGCDIPPTRPACYVRHKLLQTFPLTAAFTPVHSGPGIANSYARGTWASANRAALPCDPASRAGASRTSNRSGT